MLRTCLLLTALLLSGPVPTSAAAGVLLQLQNEFNKLAASAKPAVVNIRTLQERDYRAVTPEYFFYGIPEEYAPVYRQRLSGVGSGFFVSEDGYLLTNAHVVSGADELQVTRTLSDGKELAYTGKLVGTDPYLDLALVKIDAREKLPFLKLGDSEKVKAGDWVVAIGSPFGLQQTLTVGVISAVRQRIRIDDRVFKNMLQSDAAINRGNSGGPLINIDGEVVGMNTAIFSPSGASAGVGFSIPSSEMRKVLDRLKNGEEAAAPGWAGVALASLDPVLVRTLKLKSQYGALIQSVADSSPAQDAGLEHGDVITALDGNPVAGPEEAANYIGALKAGDKVSFEVYRRGEQKTFTVELKARSSLQWGIPRRPASGRKEQTAKWEGISVLQSEQGVVVRSVERGSPLEPYLEAGDVILGLNGESVKSLSAFVKAVKDVKLSEGVLFDVLRNGAPLYISVQKGK